MGRSQFAQRVDDVAAETVRAGQGALRLVKAVVDSAARQLDKLAEQQAVKPAQRLVSEDHDLCGSILHG